MNNSIKIPGTSFFNENALASLKIGLGLSCLVIICFWPGSRFLNFYYTRGTPVIYPAFFIFAMIFGSHHMLCFAKGDYYKKKKRHEMVSRLGPVASILRQILCLHLILGPFYLIVVTVSGVSVAGLLSSVCVVVSATLTCSATGGLCAIMFNPENLWGLMVSRIAFIFYFTVSGLIHPLLNPIYLMFRLFRARANDPVIMGQVLKYGLFSTAITLLLILAAIMVVWRHTKTLNDA